MSGFSFGSTAPATGGFSFGSTPSTTSGTGAGTGFSFGGTTNTGTGTGGFSFGGTNTSTTAAPTTGFSFGNTATSTAAPTTGFSFGTTGTTAPTTTTTTAPTTGFSFGTTGTTAPSTGFSFSMPSTTTTTSSTSAAFILPTTKFSDLSDADKNKFLELDVFFRKQTVLREDITEHIHTVHSRSNIPYIPSSYNSANPTSTSVTLAHSYSNNTHANDFSAAMLNTHTSSALDNAYYTEPGQALKLNDLIEKISNSLSTLASALSFELNGAELLDNVAHGNLRKGEMALRIAQKLTGTNVAQLQLQEKIYLPSQFHWAKLAEFQERVNLLTQQVSQVEEALQLSHSQSASAHHNSSSLSAYPALSSFHNSSTHPSSTSAYPSASSLQSILHTQHLTVIRLAALLSELDQRVTFVRERFAERVGRDTAQRILREASEEKEKEEEDNRDMIPASNNSTNNPTTQTTTNATGQTTTTTNPTGTTGFSFSSQPAAGTTATTGGTGFSFGNTTTTPAYGTSWGSSLLPTPSATGSKNSLSRSTTRRK